MEMYCATHFINADDKLPRAHLRFVCVFEDLMATFNDTQTLTCVSSFLGKENVIQLILKYFKCFAYESKQFIFKILYF